MKPSILMAGTFVMKKPDAECIHFSSVANGFIRCGHSVHIFHLSLHDSPALKSILLPEITVHEATIRAKTNNMMVLKGAATIPVFLRYLRTMKPEVLYVRTGIISGLYAIAARLCFGKHIKIITEHNGWMGLEASLAGKPAIIASIGNEIQRWSARCSDKVRAVSDGIRDYLISLGVATDKIFVQGNGTDTLHFHPKDTASRYDIGFIGNMAKWQGLDWLIEAFARLLAQKPEARLVIGGSGPEEASIRNALTQFGIENQVIMPGSIPYADVPDFINACRICIAPFRPRGSVSDDKSLSPLKIRDYAACGKPIISSRIAGLEEIEREGFGILVPPGDIEGLTDAMLRLLDKPVLCEEMGANARRYALDHYSWDLVAAEVSRQIDIITERRVCAA